MQSKLFYQIYDTLYASKDYAGEAASLMSIVENRYPKLIKNILEIGCGTGNHTLELAKSKKQITALDIDRQMVKIAESKTRNIKNVSVKPLSIQKLCKKSSEKNKYEVALAAFNVVTYIPDTYALLSFFGSVSKSLKKNGIFIFDCWNGIAAIQNPPQNKTDEIKFHGKKIKVKIESHTDLIQQKTRLDYTFNGKDRFSFDQTLWTPMQLNDALEKSALTVLECCKNFKPGITANASDWKIMFICRKT